tara:strand:+ start:30 stop:293 length:264 start_codon:yes stop_codon:yes gene_type:complete
MKNKSQVIVYWRRKYDPRRLQHLLDSEGISYHRMAKIISPAIGKKVQYSTVKKHATGAQSPRLDYIAAYADTFMLPIDYFFGGLASG